MNINLSIPCPDCGCDQITGYCKKDNTPIKVVICSCPDGSGYFDVDITYHYDNPEKIDYDMLKYKSKEEVLNFLNRCYEAENIKHYCAWNLK